MCEKLCSSAKRRRAGEGKRAKGEVLRRLIFSVALHVRCVVFIIQEVSCKAIININNNTIEQQKKERNYEEERAPWSTTRLG